MNGSSRDGTAAIPLAARLPLCKTELGSLELSISTSLKASEDLSAVPAQRRSLSYCALALVFVAVYGGARLFAPPLWRAGSTNADGARELVSASRYVTPALY